MPEFTLKLDGFDKALKQFGSEFEPKLTEAARIAINDTARWALKFVRDDMYGRVSFPSGYLEKEDRLKISRFASSSKLEADIFSRSEPTSLARFAVDAGNRDGIMVNVKRGAMPKKIRKGFIFGLKRGDVRRGNTGLVIRSDGKPSGAYKPKELGPKFPNLWLVYGPSVYQVFRMSMDRYGPEIQRELEERFEYHRARLMG